jgi:hypothetical protein
MIAQSLRSRPPSLNGSHGEYLTVLISTAPSWLASAPLTVVVR